MLTLIGSGETSERMLNAHQSLLARLPPPPRIAFLDTPAGFQLNAAELGAATAAYFKKYFSLDIALAEYRTGADSPEPAAAALARANYRMAGPGSPTYAIKLWRNSPVYAALVAGWQAGAQIVLASSAAIAISRWALPVYEIYKAGADPFWADGLDLLGPLGLELAIVPHFDNPEGKTYDTRYCFMGLPRLMALEKLLPPGAVILGIDENTACTFDFDSATVAVAGAGRVTIRFNGEERNYPSGSTFDLERLTPAHALAAAPLPHLHTPILPHPHPHPLHIPPRLREWAAERDRLRAEKKFAESDHLRNRIAAVGYAVKDSPSGPVFTLTRHPGANAVPSQLDKPAALEWSVNLLASPAVGGNNRDEILRAARSVLQWAPESLEVVIVDNGSTDDTPAAIADLAVEDARVRPVFLATDVGEGGGRNAGLRASRGSRIMILGGHMQLVGDVFTPLAATLADEAIGATGSNGLTSADLFNFDPAPTAEADAIEFYLFAFRRDRLARVGLLDEKFVFYRNIDLDWSMAFKDRGLRLAITHGLPLTAHPHPYLSMDPAERDRLSKKNYRRFLEKWRDRKDLLIVNSHH
ncbi:MAG: glycosyltransferase [Chloroflexi bacterium]|nr:glycosyltransferase [Chloroflexota bacterium]